MTGKRALARQSARIISNFKKNGRFIVKMLLYSQLLHIATVGASPITNPNSILFDHTVTKKSMQTLYRQAADASQITVLAKADAESCRHPISTTFQSSIFASQRSIIPPKKIFPQKSHDAWVHSLPYLGLTSLLSWWREQWREQAIYAKERNAQHLWKVEVADKSNSVQKNALVGLNSLAIHVSMAKSTPQKIKITRDINTSSTYIFASTKASDSTEMFQCKLAGQLGLGGVSESGLISFPLNGNILSNKLRDERSFPLLVYFMQEARAEELVVGNRREGLEKKKPVPSVQTKAHAMLTAHLPKDKKMQAFQEQLKANSTIDPLPRSGNISKPLLRQQGNERPPVAVPLAQWAQNGSLSNASLTSQQLGLSGPLSGGMTYSNVTGVFLNAQYILPLADQAALGLLGEYGPGQYRVNGTVAYGFSPLSQIKVGGEYLVQRLPFQFDSGNVMQRLHQSAYGVRFQQLFE